MHPILQIYPDISFLDLHVGDRSGQWEKLQENEQAF